MAMGSGFYAGVGVGVQDVFSELSLTDYDENGVDVARMEQGNTGFMGSLSLGYNFLFNQQVMLGLQFDGQISGVKTEHQATTTFLEEYNQSSITTKSKHGFGVNVRPGMLFNDNASGFLILGYRYIKVNHDFYENGTDIPLLSFAQNQNNHGFEYGLGTEISLTEQFGLRLEVTQTQFQTNTIFSLANVAELTSKTKLNQALLSIIWYPECY